MCFTCAARCCLRTSTRVHACCRWRSRDALQGLKPSNYSNVRRTGKGAALRWLWSRKHKNACNTCAWAQKALRQRGRTACAAHCTVCCWHSPKCAIMSGHKRGTEFSPTLGAAASRNLPLRTLVWDQSSYEAVLYVLASNNVRVGFLGIFRAFSAYLGVQSRRTVAYKHTACMRAGAWRIGLEYCSRAQSIVTI